MVLRITVESGVEYLLDKDLMNWRMFVKNQPEAGVTAYRTGGKLYFWPDLIAVGKKMMISNRDDIAGIARPFFTGVVKHIEAIKREVPDVIEEGDAQS